MTLTEEKITQKLRYAYHELEKIAIHPLQLNSSFCENATFAS